MYYSIDQILARGCTFNIVIGGRGIGKTYSTLKKMMEENIQHLYIRRTKTQVELCCTEASNPYKTLNKDLSREYTITNGRIRMILEKKEQKGFASSLSTFQSLRGVDFNEIEYIIFDEFIKGNTERETISNELDALLNLYETVNRNREFNGREPVKVIMLSNAVSIYSPILAGLDLVRVLEYMIHKGQRTYTDRERSLCLQVPLDRDFIDAKRVTALYKLAKGTQYYDHALDNHFAYDSWYNVVKKPIIQYTPYCSVDDVYFYQHKSNGEMYASATYADCPNYSVKDTFALFSRNHRILIRELYVSGRLYYESIAIKCFVETLI